LLTGRCAKSPHAKGRIGRILFRSIGYIAVRKAEGSNVISRKSVIEILVVASILIIARLAFDFTPAAAYVYPEFDFGQSRIAFVIFVVAVPCVLIFASVRL